MGVTFTREDQAREKYINELMKVWQSSQDFKTGWQMVKDFVNATDFKELENSLELFEVKNF